MSEDKLAELARLTGKLTLNLEELANSNEEIREQLQHIDSTIARLDVVVIGNPEYRVTGLAERTDRLEEIVDEIVKQRRSERDKLRGLQIGLGITIFTSGGTLLTLLTQLFSQ